MKLSPFAKAIAGGVCSAVIAAAVYFDNPYVAIAAAFAVPVSVYFVPNRV